MRIIRTVGGMKGYGEKHPVNSADRNQIRIYRPACTYQNAGVVQGVENGLGQDNKVLGSDTTDKALPSAVAMSTRIEHSDPAGPPHDAPPT